MSYMAPNCGNSNDAPRHKAGSSFEYTGKIERRVYEPSTDSSVVENNFSGWIGASQIRSVYGTLIADLTFEWLDSSEGLARIYAITATTDWPTGNCLIDIKLTAPDGLIVYTETQMLSIDPAVTLGGSPP